MASAASKTLAASIAKSGSVRHCIKACLIASLSTFQPSRIARPTSFMSIVFSMSKHTSPFPPNGLGKQEIHLLYWANDLRVKLVIGWKDPLDRGYTLDA